MSSHGTRASSVGFWGLSLSGNSQPRAVTIPHNRVLRISNASLPLSHATHTGNKPHASSLIVHVENHDQHTSTTLCTLVSNTLPSFSFDIFFMDDQKISLSTQGDAPIHVVGYTTKFDDEEEESSRALVPHAGGVDEDDDVDAEIDITQLAKQQRKKRVASQNAVRSIVDELASFGDEVNSDDELDESFRPDGDIESEDIDSDDEDEEDFEELSPDDLKQLARQFGLDANDFDDHDDDDDPDDDDDDEEEEADEQDQDEDEDEDVEEETPVQVGQKRKQQQVNGKPGKHQKQPSQQQQQQQNGKKKNKSSPQVTPQVAPKSPQQTPQSKSPQQKPQQPLKSPQQKPQQPAKSPQQKPQPTPKQDKQNGKRDKQNKQPQQQQQQRQQQQQQQPAKKQKTETSKSSKLPCPHCSKELHTDFALTQHIEAKHSK